MLQAAENYRDQWSCLSKMFSKETYLSLYEHEVTLTIAIEKQVSRVSSTNYQKSNGPVWKEVQLY